MTPRRTIAAAAIMVVVLLAVRRLRRRDPQRPALPPATSRGDRVPISVDDADELVAQASEDSFPASDPPSYWARDPLS